MVITHPRTQPRDRHIEDLRAGLSWRCAPEAFDREPAAQAKRFSLMPLFDIAAQACLADGFRPEDVASMSRSEVAMSAFGHPPAGVSGGGSMTTGSLREVTRDAMNKSLTAGYEEAPQTWRGPMRQAESVSDFSDIHRIKMGAAPNLPIWPDNAAPDVVEFGDERESYAVEARAEEISISWRLFLNDDLDALSRRPRMLGDAAARTLNKVAWSEMTNPNRKLADGVELFSEGDPARGRFRPNLITGAASPTNESIGQMRKLLRQMRGLNKAGEDGKMVEGDDILNLAPTYILFGTELEEQVLKQLFSASDPDGAHDGVFNSTRSLTPVIEPLLDASSPTAFYLTADPARVDTIEVTFLQGHETPQTHEWIDDRTMSQHFSIRQVYAARAIDHRGMIKHTGV